MSVSHSSPHLGPKHPLRPRLARGRAGLVLGCVLALSACSGIVDAPVSQLQGVAEGSADARGGTAGQTPGEPAAAAGEAMSGAQGAGPQGEEPTPAIPLPQPGGAAEAAADAGMQAPPAQVPPEQAPPEEEMPEDMPGQSGGLPLTIPGSAMDTTARCPAYVTSPAVAVAACPAQCSQCVNGTCLLRCGGVGQCSDMDFDCPDGYRCRIECSGFSNCSNLEVECAEDAPCEVVCEGFDTCEGLRMKCGDQACAVRCTGSRPQQVRLEADDACGSVLDC